MKFHETNEGKKQGKETERNISDFYAFLLRLSLNKTST
jgi:hypothetical protein